MDASAPSISGWQHGNELLDGDNPYCALPKIRYHLIRMSFNLSRGMNTPLLVNIGGVFVLCLHFLQYLEADPRVGDFIMYGHTNYVHHRTECTHVELVILIVCY